MPAFRISPPVKLVVNQPGPAMRAACDGVGFWLTFADYVSEAIAGGALVSLLDD